MDAGLNAPAEPAAVASSDFEIELQLLVEAIYLKYHYDFRSYARASLKRRMVTAMARFGCSTLSQLQDRIVHDPAVFAPMLEYLTVQVSDMFRDPGYFRALRERVLPQLRTYPSLKIWVAGCSTGEEVYSLAILLREEGLFFWFEHTGQADAAGLGTHTLVIADHNNAFKPGAQPEIRYTSSASASQ